MVVPETMRAVIRDRDGVVLRSVPAPVLEAADDVIIAVAVAGICRTDLRVADGALGAVPVVLGHELAGRVVAAGPAVRDVAVADPVMVIPFEACRGCAGCARGACLAPRWLGVDRDGGFAERVRVPAALVRRLPARMSMRLGAYVEPVAAALGVLRAGLAADARVLIAGTNRIAELTARVVAAHGVREVVRYDPARDPAPAPGSIDVAIESTGEGLAALNEALRPGGTLVVKSRAAAPAELDLTVLVAREITVRALGHGAFEAAIDWLDQGRIAVDDLLAEPWPLERFAEAFTAARSSEAQKQLLCIDDARGAGQVGSSPPERAGTPARGGEGQGSPAGRGEGEGQVEERPRTGPRGSSPPERAGT